MNLTQLIRLATLATPDDNDNEWGSDAQIEAQNTFFSELEKIVPKEAFEKLETYCLKATVEEMLYAGLETAGKHLKETTPDLLATAFSYEIRLALTRDEFKEAVRLNLAETNPLVCHTHNFCDANECMAAALERFGLETSDIGEDETLCQLWSNAWEIAKNRNFKV